MSDAEKSLARWIRNSDTADDLAGHFEDWLEAEDPDSAELIDMFEAVAKRLMADVGEEGDEVV